MPSDFSFKFDPNPAKSDLEVREAVDNLIEMFGFNPVDAERAFKLLDGAIERTMKEASNLAEAFDSAKLSATCASLFIVALGEWLEKDSRYMLCRSTLQVAQIHTCMNRKD